VLALADFNAANLAGYLANDGESPLLDVRVGPMARGVGLLMQGTAEANPDDTVIVWTEPHRVSSGFASLVACDNAEADMILAQVDEFADAVAALGRDVRTVLVPSWVIPQGDRGLGMLGMRHNVGPANMLMHMNVRLTERLSTCDNVHVLDAQRWMQIAGRQAYDPRLWFLGKIPFGNQVFKEAASDIKAALRAVCGESRKLVVLDLDDTLWGGVLGDEGWQKLRLGGHDAIGEAFVEFQRALKRLTRRGILLAIVSKNDEEPALEAIATHPEMVLRPSDFSAWRINWEDKARNIAALAAELNLGLQSVVFIDDNPVERDRVSKALPEVLVPEWPASPVLFSSVLTSLTCFDTAAVTAEDRQRHQAYQSESARAHARETAASLDDWLRDLQMKVHVEELSDGNAMRAIQLLNKTNQMNLSTRRLTGPELRAWASDPCHKLWVFRVADKFGDAGLTGIVSLEMKGEEARIVDFVLSCRVIGRQVEEAMLYQAVRYAGERGMRTLAAQFVATPKNGPCLQFLQRSGLANDGQTFRWELSRPYAAPRHVDLQIASDAVDAPVLVGHEETRP
jgi:FkbH-like protein